MAKILLVEDDTNLSEIYQARMEAEGYTVVAAADGETALALAAKEKPDLILSDVMMPKISGFEMLDILRNTDGLKHTRVIMLTALGQAEDKTRAESLGADRYLVKSQVTLEDIVSAAQELLGDGDESLPTPAELAAPTVAAAPAAMTPEPAPAVVAAVPVQPAPSDPLAATTPAAIAPPVAVEPAPVAVAPAPAPVATPETIPEVQALAEPAPAAAVAPAPAPVPDPAPVAPAPAPQPAPVTTTPPPTPLPEPVASVPAPIPTPALEPTPVAPAPAVEAAAPLAEPISPLPPAPAAIPVTAAPDSPDSDVTAAPTTPANTSAIDERVVASAIDRLLSKTPETATPPSGVATPPAEASPEAAADDRAHGKTITPIERPAEPSLQELVAKEDAEAAAALAKAQADNAGNTNPAKKSTDFDPNSISL